MKKGLELPINILVIVAVAVIVLLGVVALFLTGFSPLGQQLQNQNAAKNQACAELLGKGCTVNTQSIRINDFDANGDGTLMAGTSFSWDNIDDYVENEDGNEIPSINNRDNLASLCAYKYNIQSELECKALCGC